MNRHFNKQGELISFAEWCALFDDTSYRVVKKTELGEDRFVSTVWLGLDHGFGGELQIFETMDFPGQEIQERYATLEEAAAGHDAVVATIEKGLKL